MKRSYAYNLPEIIVRDNEGREIDWQAPPKPADVEGVPANCLGCPNFIKMGSACRVLLDLQENCFVLRQMISNAERGIFPK